jgi:hypothetical protein
MELLEAPLASAEFVAVDTETNGIAGDGCELAEVGAVLVGGGELHATWASLVATERPLSRGIQRFTGISQAMVEQAPAAVDVLPRLAQLLDGRVLVAHSAPFDVRVLRQAFERVGLEWPAPPALCTLRLARRFAPLATRRGLASLAAALGIDVGRIYVLAFGLGCFMAGLGGAIIVPKESAVLGMGVDALVLAFIVVVVGGLGSLEGALVGALIVGFVREAGIAFFPEIELAVLYLIAAIVLLVRPAGLFGRA